MTLSLTDVTFKDQTRAGLTPVELKYLRAVSASFLVKAPGFHLHHGEVERATGEEVRVVVSVERLPEVAGALLVLVAVLGQEQVRPTTEGEAAAHVKVEGAAVGNGSDQPADSERVLMDVSSELEAEEEGSARGSVVVLRVDEAPEDVVVGVLDQQQLVARIVPLGLQLAPRETIAAAAEEEGGVSARDLLHVGSEQLEQSGYSLSSWQDGGTEAGQVGLLDLVEVQHAIERLQVLGVHDDADVDLVLLLVRQVLVQASKPQLGKDLAEAVGVDVKEDVSVVIQVSLWHLHLTTRVLHVELGTLDERQSLFGGVMLPPADVEEDDLLCLVLLFHLLHVLHLVVEISPVLDQVLLLLLQSHPLPQQLLHAAVDVLDPSRQLR
mmetsp:Transcript_17680/g.58196  ORF Transcript_17680/g.58196 Transcript_17680/m.58196 type:complete len:381 (+) Transcript_17680:59-1201(+)